MTSSPLTSATVPLNRLDELFLVLDDGHEPWNVHFEVRMRGRLDPDRLADAIRAAVLRHPLARARLADWRYCDRGYRWEIEDALVDVPLRIEDCADERALATAREELLGQSPRLDAPPPFMVLLARGPGGDSVVLNLHHAAGDGISAMRLMLSILHEYGGVADPAPAVDPLAVHDVRALARATSPADRLRGKQALARSAARPWTPRARLAVDGGSDRRGYGVEVLALSREETAAVLALRTDGTTVNDVLLAALAVAIHCWNAAHGRALQRVALSMPINLRPPAWRSEVMGNFASYASLPGTAADDFPAALADIGRQTRAVKSAGLGGLVVDQLAGYSKLPIAAKRWLPNIIDLTRDAVVDTASLSNLGLLPDLGADVDGIAFSPPGRMPLGLAVGVATHHERLQLALRYPYKQFGAAAGTDFAGLYRDVLLAD